VKILVTFVKLFHQNNQKNIFVRLHGMLTFFFFFFGQSKVALFQTIC
jgi:hypothetical protein